MKIAQNSNKLQSMQKLQIKQLELTDQSFTSTSPASPINSIPTKRKDFVNYDAFKLDYNV